MTDESKTKEQLINEVTQLRRQVTELETSETERKRGEEALRESEGKYGNIVETMNDALIMHDMEGRILSVNSSTCELLGYEKQEIIGEHISKYTSEESIKRSAEHLNQLSEEGSIVFDSEAQRSDGSIVQVNISAKVISKEGKRFVQSFLRDITERKKAEEALRESEEEFRTFMETASDMMHMADKDGNITYVNESMARTLGYSKEEMIGMHITQILSEEGLADFELNVEKLMRQGEFTAEPVRLRKEGEEICGELKVVAVYDSDGQYAGARGVFRDITERKKAEAELQLRAQLLDNASDLIFLHGLDGNLMYANEMAYRSHGYTREEFVGMSLRQLGTPEYDRLVEQRFQQVAEEGRATFEIAHFRKDRSILPLEVHSRVIEAGGRKLILTVARDITERKKAEARLKELYEEETKARQKLEQEIEKRIELTRALVHELKTPLVPMLASSEGLLNLLRQKPDSLRGRLARSIHRGASNLNMRIDELLDLAKGELNILEVKPAVIAPLRLLQRIAEETTPMISARRQSLILDLPSSLPLIQADEERLRQVVLNLLTNASKFGFEEVKITLRARKRDADLVIEVKDTSRGIAKEDQERVFDAYQQVESDRERLSGLGIGLALCKKLVELHGGRTWVESARGKGSTFSFSLPLEAGKRDGRNR